MSAAFFLSIEFQETGYFVERLFRASYDRTPSMKERDALVNGLNDGTETRAGALRRVAEQAEFARRETTRAFVLMQYFGYLRRDPDEAGFNFWLEKLERFGGNYEQAEMVCAFILSIEYGERFGS